MSSLDKISDQLFRGYLLFISCSLFGHFALRGHGVSIYGSDTVNILGIFFSPFYSYLSGITFPPIGFFWSFWWSLRSETSSMSFISGLQNNCSYSVLSGWSARQYYAPSFYVGGG